MIQSHLVRIATVVGASHMTTFAPSGSIAHGRVVVHALRCPIGCAGVAGFAVQSCATK
jgi:hypothetical protein